MTLFEAEPSCGGHTLTDSTGQWPVDLGFQVRNMQLVVSPLLIGTSKEQQWQAAAVHHVTRQPVAAVAGWSSK